MNKASLQFLINHKSYFINLFLALLFLSIPITAFGFTFSSDSYIIDWGNFNITSGKKTSANLNLTDTVGQNAPGQYTRNGYILKSGFQYIYDTTYPFSFSIDNLTIDFGFLTPGVGKTAVNNITVSSPAGHGYQIMVAENHPLQNINGDTIPDFPGDNNLASESVTDTWTEADTYGFGLNASGNGTSSYFASSSLFRQFADARANEIPQVIMSENSPQRNRTAAITYKANISSQQASGTYQNAITFIAVPKY